MLQAREDDISSCRCIVRCMMMSHESSRRVEVACSTPLGRLLLSLVSALNPGTNPEI